MPTEKDVSEKILEDHNDVFADIINNLVFDGREVVKADELENAPTVSQLKMADGLHEQERDTAKYWRRGAFIIAAFGLENQSWEDFTMPLRLFSYDGAFYNSQVNRYRSERQEKRAVSPLYPAITIVLYFGKRHWYGPRTLRECFRDLPEELEPFIPDYPIHIVEVAFLTPEQIQRMKSDFRFVADYLVQTRTGGKYIPPDTRIHHVDETLKLMGALIGDNRFQRSINELASEEKEEGISMRNFIDDYIDRRHEETRKKYEIILADRDRALADSKRALADKDREIQELKSRLGIV